MVAIIFAVWWALGDLIVEKVNEISNTMAQNGLDFNGNETDLKYLIHFIRLRVV